MIAASDCPNSWQICVKAIINGPNGINNASDMKVWENKSFSVSCIDLSLTFILPQLWFILVYFRTINFSAMSRNISNI